jgi:protein required for attachment to host cells
VSGKELSTVPDDRNLLIVIADGEHARFVRPGAGNALHSDTAFDSVWAHKRSSELGLGHPGTSFHTGSPAHHSVAPRHDPHALAKQRFAELVGEQLNAAADRDEFEQLVIVAPPHVLAEIRKELGSAAATRIVGTLGKDLVNIPDHELWPHVAQWVQPGP